MYGILFSIGLVLSAFVAQKLAKKQSLKTEVLLDLIFYSVIGGVIGARIFHVIDYWELYSKNPVQILEIYKGGLGIFGGLLGGGVAFYLFLRIKQIPVTEMLKFLDVFAVCIPLAQSIGRWGNYFNHELFGGPSSLPIAIYIPFEFRPKNLKSFETFHPLFLYESVLNLVLFAALYYLSTKAKKSSNKALKMFDGDIFLLYLLGYGLTRLVLEPLRIRHFYVQNINAVTVIALLLILFSTALFILRRKNGNSKRAQRS